MDRETKIERHRELTEVIKAVEAINGPWSETQEALRLLNHLLAECMDGDAIFTGCETCEDVILESEIDGAVSGEDSGWFCSQCVARWNNAAAQERPQP